MECTTFLGHGSFWYRLCFFPFRVDTDSRKNESVLNFQELTSSMCDVHPYFGSLGGYDLLMCVFWLRVDTDSRQKWLES